MLLKTSIVVGALASIATNLQDVLFPYGVAVTMNKANGNQGTFSSVDYENRSMLDPGK